MAAPPFVLDVTKPLDTENASAGSQEIRTTRDQLKSAFEIGHVFSTGVHGENSARIGSGTEATKPAAGTKGRLWFSTDNGRLWYDTGVAWTLIAEEKLRWFVGASDAETAAADGVLRDVPSLTQTLVASGEPVNMRASMIIYLSGTTTGLVKVILALLMDTTEFNRVEAHAPAGTNVAVHCNVEYIFIPTAASHVFKVQWAGVKTVGGDVVSLATGPGVWNGSLTVPRMMLVQEVIGNAI